MSNSSTSIGMGISRLQRQLCRLTLVITLGFHLPTLAQDRYSSEQLQKHFQKTAETYVMEAEGQSLRLREKPLMNWLNNERQQDRGALYVWELQGRPVALASIFSYEYNSKVYCRHEMISLAEGPLTAKFDSQTVWSPQKSGMDWRPVEQSLTPANTANRRLIEMRSIAKQFSGKLFIPGAQPSKLIFLPQPLHRYESIKQGITDGAIFSFAVGTDPEILLVIEAKENAGKSSYRYSPLRSHYHALELEKDGAIVWKVPSEIALQDTAAGQRPYCNQPFFVLTPVKSLPSPAELE